jgi:hypothetical protein
VKFLVDANILSEATQPRPDEAALAWLSRHETELAVNPIILGELEYGILLLPAGKKRERSNEKGGRCPLRTVWSPPPPGNTTSPSRPATPTISLTPA